MSKYKEIIKDHKKVDMVERAEEPRTGGWELFILHNSEYRQLIKADVDLPNVNDPIETSAVDTSGICISSVLAMMLCEAHVSFPFDNIAAWIKCKYTVCDTTQNLCMVSEVKAKTTKQWL